MRKFRLSMLALFCGGLLLIGIGVGVTFTEFSDLTYGGRRVPGQAQSREQTFSVKLGDKGGPVYLEEYYSYGPNLSDVLFLKTSETVAPNSMEVRVVYDTVGPEIHINTSDDQADNAFYVNLGWKNWDDMAVLMACKDEVIQDLKAGKIASYIPVQMTRVTITANPADAARINLSSSVNVVEITA